MVMMKKIDLELNPLRKAFSLNLFAFFIFEFDQNLLLIKSFSDFRAQFILSTFTKFNPPLRALPTL